MPKIWLKSVDPNRQCCGCEGKAGPCDSCCAPGDSPLSFISVAGLNKKAIARLTSADGSISYSNNTISASNSSPTENFTFTFQLTLRKNESIVITTRAGELNNTLFPSFPTCNDGFSSVRLPASVDFGFLSKSAEEIIGSQSTVNGDTLSSEQNGSAEFLIYSCPFERILQDINLPDPDGGDNTVHLLSRDFSSVSKGITNNFELLPPVGTSLTTYPNRLFSFFRNQIDSAYYALYNNTFNYSCPGLLTSPSCSQIYSYFPRELVNANAPQATSTNSIKINTLYKYSIAEQTYSNLSSSCVAVVMSNNSEVSFLDSSLNPIDISRRIIPFN